jgi:hypothetical protein
MATKSFAFLPLALVLPLTMSQGATELSNWKILPEFSTPSAVVVRNADGTATTCWYVKFSVKNATGAARKLSPYVSLTTDTKKTYAASYVPRALDIVKLREGKDVVDVFEFAGDLNDGDSKTFVAIFEGVDVLANQYAYRVQGFGAALVRHGKDFTQQQLDYVATFHRWGNEHRTISSPVTCVSGAWEVVASKKVR